jgi:hypothetical protein
MADWSLVLTLAPVAIQHLHWVGDRPFLAGILNVVARALAPNDPESAAVLQGASRRFVPAVHTPRAQHSASSSVIAPAGPTPGAASFVTELRRQTTATLGDILGEERLRHLRAEGEAMDDDHVVAYALNAIGPAARDVNAPQ